MQLRYSVVHIRVGFDGFVSDCVLFTRERNGGTRSDSSNIGSSAIRSGA
jgi:hypothetical protein